MRYGDGSIFQRASDGRWIGRLPDGRGGHQHVTATDRPTVVRRLRELRRDQDRMTSSSDRRGGERVRDFLHRWLDDVAAVRLRPRTLEGHRQLVANHLVPRLGRHRVRDLGLSDVQAMVNAMTASGYAPQTVHNTLRVLSVALRHAEREELVERNVARLVQLPRRNREPLPSLTTAQVRRFLTLTREEPHWPLWVLAATTGMRSGELLSLRWKDVSEEAGTVTVAGTYRYTGKDATGAMVWRWEEPKTIRSRRTLTLPALAVTALRVQKGRATSATLVFGRRGGNGPMEPTHVLRLFKAALARHKLPKVRLHSLRHAAAHILLDEMGGDLRAVMGVLGHQNIGTTVDLYGGAADEARKRAAKAMDRAMRGLG